MNSRLVLQDANQMIDYTYDGERVAKTVTEKKTSKKVNLKKERTDAQKKF
jgi:hypothetical protein